MVPDIHGQASTVTAVPSSLTIYPGQQNVPVGITVGKSTYTGPITVTLTGLPSGITVTPLTLSNGASVSKCHERFFEKAGKLLSSSRARREFGDAVLR